MDLLHKIAYLNSKDGLVRIEKLDYREKPVYKKTGFMKKEQVDTEKVLDKVWWTPILDNSGRIYSATMSALYDWNDMIKDARLILSQTKELLKEKS